MAISFPLPEQLFPSYSVTYSKPTSSRISWDPEIQRGVQIYFKPEGILCSHDQKDDCKHIQFALSKPDIKAVVKKRRKEGWKLPIV